MVDQSSILSTAYDCTEIIDMINKILVFPSSRSEQRVYLGTGFRMKNYNKDQSFRDLNYAKQAYKSLTNIYCYVQFFWGDTNKNLSKNILINDGKLEQYLKVLNFNQKLKLLKNNSLYKEQFIKQFHKWFDFLKYERSNLFANIIFYRSFYKFFFLFF